MIVSSASDYREAARRKLPRFLFDYIDGGANAEQTLKANIADLTGVSLRQRVLKDVSDLSLGTEWFGQPSALPVILAPVGLTGMFA
ncbi:MAG: alpha-hydroxy-acid oxidizing protein, partial [Methylocystis sp.]